MPQTTKNEKFIFALVKGFNDAGELEAVASTGALDRQNEMIKPDAWKDSLPTYRSNPVILATHLHRLSTGDSPVIGSATAIEITADGLVFRMKFAGTDLGKQYEQLYREKHMRAFSVGFYPIDGGWEDFNRGGKNAKRTWVHTKVDLLEISAVPVPANPEALARMQELAAKVTSRDTDESAIRNLQSAIKDASTNYTNHTKEISDQQKLILDSIAEIRELITLSSDPLGFDSPPGKTARQADDVVETGADESQGAELQEAAASLRQALK